MFCSIKGSAHGKALGGAKHSTHYACNPAGARCPLSGQRFALFGRFPGQNHGSEAKLRPIRPVPQLTSRFQPCSSSRGHAVQMVLHAVVRHRAQASAMVAQDPLPFLTLSRCLVCSLPMSEMKAHPVRPPAPPPPPPPAPGTLAGVKQWAHKHRTVFWTLSLRVDEHDMPYFDFCWSGNFRAIVFSSFANLLWVVGGMVPP